MLLSPRATAWHLAGARASADVCVTPRCCQRANASLPRPLSGAGFVDRAFFNSSRQFTTPPSPAVVADWTQPDRPRALRYNLVDYTPEGVVLVGDGTGDGWKRGEIGAMSGGHSRLDTEVSRDPVGPFGGGRSILSVDMGYTDECGQGHFAVCLSEPTSFIVAHGHGDGWKRKHMMMYAITVHISPLILLEATRTAKEVADARPRYWNVTEIEHMLFESKDAYCKTKARKGELVWGKRLSSSLSFSLSFRGGAGTSDRSTPSESPHNVASSRIPAQCCKLARWLLPPRRHLFVPNRPPCMRLENAAHALPAAVRTLP